MVERWIRAKLSGDGLGLHRIDDIEDVHLRDLDVRGDHFGTAGDYIVVFGLPEGRQVRSTRPVRPA